MNLQDFKKKVFPDATSRFAYDLYFERHAQKLSQAALIKKMNTNSRSQVSRIENGEISPTIKTMEKIAKALGKKLKITFE